MIANTSTAPTLSPVSPIKRVQATAPVEGRLNRQVFTTSRLLYFCSQKELVLQTSHPVDQWPLVILTELIDNALHACEEANVAPQLQMIVHSGPASAITVVDNAGGIAPETVKSLLDFSVRVSSREAFASPTRGAQGDALKTLIAMPIALDGAVGTTTIRSRSRPKLLRALDQWSNGRRPNIASPVHRGRR